MADEIMVVEGIARVLEGLEDIMDALSDTGPNSELLLKIIGAIEAAQAIVGETCLEAE